MSVVDIREYQEEIVLHFGGERKKINAYTLASTLVSIADAVKEANNVINQGYDVEVLVEAFGEGSFRAIVKTIYKGKGNLFSTQDLKSVALSILASYIFVHTLAPESEVKVNVNSELVIIEQGDKKIIIPREVHEMQKDVEKSKKFKGAVSKIFRVVVQDENIVDFGITKQLKDLNVDIKVDRNHFEQFIDPVLPEENMRTVIETTEVQIVKAILDRSKRKWEFVWRGINISAPVLHDAFYDDFFAHRIKIAPGDGLRVRLEIFQVKQPDTGIFTNNKYRVVEVIEHIPKVKQLEM
jgi:hypothetical protein